MGFFFGINLYNLSGGGEWTDMIFIGLKHPKKQGEGPGLDALIVGLYFLGPILNTFIRTTLMETKRMTLTQTLKFYVNGAIESTIEDTVGQRFLKEGWYDKNT